MSNTDAQPMNNDSPRDESGDRILAIVNYVLSFLAIFNGITIIAAVILAYVRRDQANEWLKSHFSYQIRTFWYALIFFVVGLLTFWILIGFLIWFIGGVWLVIRSVVGLMRVLDGRPQNDPNGYWL